MKGLTMLRSIAVTAVALLGSTGQAQEVVPRDSEGRNGSFREGILDMVFPLTRELMERALSEADYDFAFPDASYRVSTDGGMRISVPPMKAASSSTDNLRVRLDKEPIYFDAPPTNNSAVYLR